jgi:hypothetical protein
MVLGVNGKPGLFSRLLPILAIPIHGNSTKAKKKKKVK